MAVYSKFWPKGGLPGVLHHFTESLVTFEFKSGAQPKPDSLIFVGGLSDGLGTVAFVADIVKALDSTSWSVFQPVLSSSYQGWGTGGLDQDVTEIARCVEYVKDIKSSISPSARIVLMGHSTGSQDVLHYLSRELTNAARPAVDGAILQAPVSDRQAVHLVLESGFLGRSPQELRATYTQLEALSKAAVQQGKADDTILPVQLTSQFGYPAGTPINCRRWLSLVSPSSPVSPGQDDMFSSDLPVEHLQKTFGTIRSRALLRQKLMVLMSGADQAVPASIDKEALLARWKEVVDGDQPSIWDVTNSGIVVNASHALSNDDQAEPRHDLATRVSRYLLALE